MNQFCNATFRRRVFLFTVFGSAAVIFLVTLYNRIPEADDIHIAPTKQQKGNRGSDINYPTSSSSVVLWFPPRLVDVVCPESIATDRQHLPASEETRVQLYNQKRKIGVMVPFTFFDKGHIYDGTGVTMEPFAPDQKLFIQKAVSSAAHKIHTQFSKFEFGNYRLLGGGLEYQLFFKGTNESVSPKVSLFHRFARPPYIREITYSNEKEVNIVISLQSKLDVLNIFLDNLVINVLPVDPHLTLTIVYFKDNNESKAKSLLEEKLKLVPSFKWSMVMVKDEKFSRGKGLRIGADFVAKLPFQLIFFSDVDIFMKPHFFKRCRANAVEHHQVYYPMVFSLYNPKVVYALKQNNIPPIQHQLSVDENHGFWRHFGYGMVCLHRREFDAAGGIPDLKTWGGEDERLYNNIISLGSIKIIRAPDPALFHAYHHKQCHELSGFTYLSCVRSKAANEGSQMQLGLLLLRLQEGINIDGALYSWMYECKLMLISCIMALFLCIFVIIVQCMALSRRRITKLSKHRSSSS